MIEIIYSVCKCDPCRLGGKGGLSAGEFGIEGIRGIEFVPIEFILLIWLGFRRIVAIPLSITKMKYYQINLPM